MSAISRNAFDKIYGIADEEKPHVTLRMANGTESLPTSQMTCDISIGNGRFSATLVVIDNFPYDLLLGIDFLQDHDALLNFGQGEAWIGDTCFKFPTSKVAQNETNGPITNRNLRTAKRIRIPARTEMAVSVKCSRNAKGVYLVEGSRIAAELGITVGCSLSKPSHRRLLVRVANESNGPIVIAKGMPIATAESMDLDDECDSLNDDQLRSILSLSSEPDCPETVQSGPKLNIGPGLKPDERRKLDALLAKYDGIMSKNDMDTGLTDLIEHDIDTGDARPIKQRPYRLSFSERKQVNQLVKNFQDSGWIRESTSPWACPIVLVKKKDGGLRFCCDWRKLNSVTKKDAMPLPLIVDMIDRHAKARYFSKIDFTSGFYQVRLVPDAIEKTAFVTPDGHYEWTVMGMGLTNAPATFQRLMHKVLGSLMWKHSMAYMDDLIVFSSNFDEHIRNLAEVFECIQNAGLKMKPSKCAFAKNEIQYLGHIITANGVRCDPANIDKVRAFSIPKNRKEVRSFLGLTSYYRRFIKDYAFIAKPLHELTKETVSFKWERNHTKAFELLRLKLTEPPVLAFPDFEKEFIVSTDASGFGVGCVLKQLDEKGQERVIAYASRVLRPEEQRYSATEREFLALRYATQIFRPYLYGKEFTVMTDHLSLTQLRKMKNPNGRLQRWNIDLLDFTFNVRYKPGKTNNDADSLSRYGMEDGEFRLLLQRFAMKWREICPE